MSEHPVFNPGSTVALVETKAPPHTLGVALKGGRFVCQLPDGYDGQTNIRMHAGKIIVAHPMLPPLSCDPNTGKCELIHIENWALPNANKRAA